MANPNNEEEYDFDEMTDEEFMKLDPSKLGVPDEDNKSDDDENSDDVSSSSEDSSDETENESVSSNEEEGDEETPPTDSDEGDEPESGETPEIIKDDKSKNESENTEKQEDLKKNEPESKSVKTDSKAAVDFFEKVTASFKADGKDMQVRSPEDVIRLMQMGVNYSRRMQEMKPLRAQDQMLRQNGLNDPEKLNFLIDLYKGNKDAIKKLLIDHKIDPIDVDTSTEDTPYTANNYQVDPKDSAFDDAIKETLAQDGGSSLINDINKDWDNTSKEALRDQPSIFQNILAQRRSGVYAQIKAELDYQRTMGYLTDVPFLAAYHQVGEAMEKAGVFNPKVQPAVKKPIGTGIRTRKAALKPNTEQPTPNVSSATPPRSVSTNVDRQNTEPDYSSMSDEDFLKLSPP